MGTCNGLGTECICNDSPHRSSADQCKTYNHIAVTASPTAHVTASPTPSTISGVCTSRSFCNNRGNCNAAADGCVCDDIHHYWNSERCSTHHDGRELQPGQFCWPNTVSDYYCGYMGDCSADGSVCACHDSDHRLGSERCSIYHHSPSVAPTVWPTRTPTLSPTANPTQSPTTAPTLIPGLCMPGDRSFCSDRGYCAPTGDACLCDDYLHYWPSEHCSTWHDGRELISPGDYCYPDTVDQYCSWMGVCNSDGSECLCFDSEHRTSADRCLNWHFDLTTAAPSMPGDCNPGDRSFCSDRGYCAPTGDTCLCDDYLHYWPSEHCSTWHDGRELIEGQCCSPDTVDQYCSWMGVCNSDGSECLCFDSEHRYSGDRCANWYPVLPAPASSTSSDTIATAELYPPSGNETCLFITLVDNFGDNWDNAVLVASSVGFNDTSVETLFTLHGCSSGHSTSGCLPLNSPSVFLSIRDYFSPDNSSSSPPFYWDVQWSAETIVDGQMTGDKYYGGFDTSLEFFFNTFSGGYELTWWESMWVYPEESVVCGLSDSTPGCSPISVTLFDCAGNSTNGTSFLGGDYQEAAWYISSAASGFRDVHGYGVPWSASTSFTEETCSNCLPDGSYVFEVTGANYPSPECIHWSFCGVGGGGQTKLYFDIVGGSCVVTDEKGLGDFCLDEVTCPPLTIFPPTPVPPPTIGPPTVLPPSVGPPTVLPPSVGPPTVLPPSVGPPTVLPPSVGPPTVLPPSILPPSTPSPTVHPTTGSPSATTIPDILNVSPRTWEVHTSNLTVNVEVTVSSLGGSVWCAAYIQGTSPTRSYDIVTHGFGTSTSALTSAFSAWIEVELQGLIPYNHYDIWCVAQDTLGNTDPLWKAYKLSSIWVEFCKTTTLNSSPSGYGFAAATTYNSLAPDLLGEFSLSFTLDYSPKASLTVTPVVYEGNNKRLDVSVHPSSFVFTSVNQASALSGSFYLSGPAGTYNVELEYTSTGFQGEFCGSESAGIQIISGGLSAVPPVLPTLQSVHFDVSGQKLILIFDSSTDYASSVVTTDSWVCSSLFSFPGASNSLCFWRDSRTVVAHINSLGGIATVVAGNTVTTNSGVLKGTCYEASCASNPFADTSSVVITVPNDHVSGTAVLVAPSVTLSCLDLVLDPTMSNKHGGRAWRTVSWMVSATDGSDVSAIQAVLDGVTSTDVPVTIEKSLLHATVYQFSLGLLNFMDVSNSNIMYTTVEVDVRDSGPVVSLSFATPPLIEVEQSIALIIDASAGVLNCVPDSTSYSYSYVWMVYKNGQLTAIPSTSTNPAVFTAAGNLFDLDGTYTVTLTVTATSGPVVLSSTKSVTVYGVQTYVKARISGGSSALSIMTNEVLTLHGSDSVGSALDYRWTCKYTNAALFNQDCGQPATSAATLVVPANMFSAGTNALITLTVSTGSLSSSASVAVTVVAYHVDLAKITLDPPVPPIQFDAADNLNIFTTITSSAIGGADAAWSVQGSFLNLNTASLVTLFQSFTHATLSNGVTYPFGVYANSLTGGKTYSFELLVSQPVGKKFLVVDIEVNSPPIGGSLAVTPSTGVAYDTAYTFSAPLWGDDSDSLPLRYQFVYQISNTFDWTATHLRASPFRTFAYKLTTLPAGLPSAGDVVAAGVIVRDVWGADAFGNSVVTVVPSVRRNLAEVSVSSSIESLYNALDAHDLSSANEQYQMSLNILNDISRADCSLAPNCAALNRDICTTTQHTCGSCLSEYAGVYGHANYQCHAASETKSGAGQSCSSNSDCEYGSCVSNKCSVPAKPCPLGADGSVCSDQGTCSYFTGQGIPVSSADCSVENTNCIATCACDVGYGSSDCGLAEGSLTEASASRETLCSALVLMTDLIQPVKEKLEMMSDYLVQVFDASQIYDDDLASCNNALSHLASYISGADVNIGRTNRQTVNVISEFATLSNNVSQTSILAAVSALESYTHNTMIAGQAAVLYVSPNFRVAFHYPALSALIPADDLVDNVALAAPRTDEEVAYGADAYSVSLPRVGLDMCGALEDYALITLTVWVQNPYDLGSTDLQGKLFQLSTFSTGGTDENTVGTNEAYWYEVDLFLDSAIDSQLEAPVCNEYFKSSNIIQKCAYCNVSEFAEKSATISCVDSSDYFCPATSGTGRRTSVHRILQTSQDKMYSLSVRSTDFSTRGINSDEVSKSQGIFTFIIIFLCVVFGSVFVLYLWDRSDRREFIALAATNFARASSSKDFNLSAAFDDAGQKSGETINVAAVAKVAADLRASSFSHSLTGDRSSKFSFFNPTGASDVDRAGIPIPSLSPTKQSLMDGEDGPGAEMTTRRKKLPSEHVVDLDVLSEKNVRESQPVRSIPESHSDAVATPDSLVWNNLPPSSLLSDHDWFTRVFHAFSRHHKWARIFTYPSMRRTRVIRFLVAATDLMVVIFVNTLFYSIFYPDDETCQDHSFTSPEKCLADDGKFDSSKSLCQWHSNGDCTLRDPPFNVKFIVSVTMIVIVFAAIPRSILQFILEKLCARRPVMEDVGLKTKDFLQDEPATPNATNGDSFTDKSFEINNPTVGKSTRAGLTSADVEPYALAQCDHMSSGDEVNLLVNTAKDYFSSSSRSSAGAPMVFMMDAMRSGLRLGNDGSPRPLTVRQWCLFGSPDKHIKWKVDKARAESTVLVEKAWGLSQAGPDQFEWTDLVVMQHFIMEQLSPITRFCLKKSIFEMDHATPGRIGFLYWSSAWAVVLGCWGFMAYWIIHWTLTNGVGPARAWGLVVGIVVIADTLMNQLTQIYFLNVHMTDKMRPQLREIFGVLNDCLHMRLLKRVSPFDGARIVQHMSAACRAVRAPGVSENICAYVLALVDDIDVYLCRRHRLESLREVGIIAWATLFHPALLNGTYDICQQTVMDLIIPVAWCCFILLNYAVTLVSIYFLIALWIVSVAAMVAFYYWNTSKPAYAGLSSHSAQITSKTTSSTNDKPFRISVTDDMANLYRDSCKEDAYGCSPMAGGSAVVEMAPLSTQDVLLGGDVGDEVFTHHSSSQEIAVAGESDTLL